MGGLRKVGMPIPKNGQNASEVLLLGKLLKGIYQRLRKEKRDEASAEELDRR